MSNLLAFFQGQISDQDVLAGLPERTTEVQLKVEKALNKVEAALKENPSPPRRKICQWVCEMMETWDEEVFAEAFGTLFPKNPAVTLALKGRAINQIRALGNFVLKHSHEEDLDQRAHSLLALAEGLETKLRSLKGT
jgi:hypothetical protein